jgi:MFS family permease
MGMRTMISSYRLPLTSHSNIRLFYLLTITTNAFFIVGNWIFFWTRFMTYGQLGFVDASCFAFGMLMEIPTGAVSDLIGKKKTLLAALFLSSLGVFVITPASNIVQIVIGFLIAQIGWALYSGAAEAFAYDTLKDEGLEAEFDEVISASSMVSIVTVLIATLVGIWLYQIDFRLTHFAWGMSYLVGFFLCFFLKEPRTDSVTFSFAQYFNQLSQGAHQLLQPTLRKFIILIFALLGVHYLFSYGFVKPAMAEGFGWYAKEQGIVSAGLSLFAAILSRLIPWMRKKLSDMQGLVLLTGILGLGFVIASFSSGWFGVVPFILIVGAGSLSSPWVSVVINREIPSQYRATTLSTVAMMTKIPYILTAVIAGGMIQEGKLALFTMTAGLLTILSIGLSKVVNGKIQK